MEERVRLAVEGEHQISQSDLSDVQFIQELANSARQSENRQKLLKENKFSEANWSNESSHEMLIELCRLFGNLCFNNPTGRSLVKRLDLFTTMNNSLQNVSNQHFLNTKLILVLPAFLQNFCIENMENVNLILPILNTMSKILAQSQQYENTGPYEDLVVLLAYSEHVTQLFSEEVVAAASNIIKAAGGDISTDFVSALIALTEDDGLSSLFYHQGVHTVLMDNLEKDVYSGDIDEDCDKSVKDVCAELAVMVTASAQLQDISIPLLTSWMKRDPTLSSTAFIILGNLCNSDAKTEAVVTPELLKNVIQQMTDSTQKPVLHALLGCLRNFAVNPKSRDLLINHLVGTRLIMMSKHINDDALMLKLVSILRLLALSNETVARSIGDDGEFIKRLIEMGQVTNHFSTVLGQLNVETGRLFSTVIVKSQNPGIMRSIVDRSGLPHLLSLLSSPHLVMLNQAILPLCLIYTLDPLPEIVTTSMTCDVLKKILDILNNTQPQDGYIMVHENVLKLITIMMNTKDDQTLHILSECDVKGRIETYSATLDPELHQTNIQISNQILQTLP
jgi:hypothetical protein